MVRGVNLVPRSHSVAVGDLGTGVRWGEGHTISYTKQDDNKMDKTQSVITAIYFIIFSI